tara:strand:- start:200 stop:1948 length:1749 start_codon:yes stop_codon:yes gene_type:complete
MAKSLLGKADSTLAAMSLKESMADVMPDYSDIYKAEAEGFKENLTAFQKTVGDYFDNLNADNNALADELKEAVSTTMADLSMGETPDEAGMELFNTELNKLRQRLNNTPPGKNGELDRAKITAEMERLKSSTDGMSNTLIDLGVRIENGDFIPNATGNENMQILKAINDRTANRQIVNGDLVYSIPGSDKKITQQDLRKMLVSNDPSINKAVNAVTVKAGTLGKTKGMKWEDNRQEIINGYRESLSTKSGLAANMHQPQGPLKYSFADYLSGKGDKKYNAQIWSALKEAGVNVPEDKDGDGKITEKDFATPENGIAMIKRLTQIDDDGFDLAGTKNIVSEFLADYVGKKEFDDNRRVIDTPDITETDDNPYNLPKELKMGPVMPNGYQQKESRQQVQTWINSLKSGRKIQYMGSEYTFRDGKWVENYGIEGVEQKIIGSADNMRDDVFQTDFPAFDNIITEPEAEKIDHSTGKTASQNPFGDGAGEIAKLPSDFIKAVGNDDLKVKEYLDNMKIPGLNVKASGFGSDSIVLSLGGKTKVFIVDTNFTDDEDRASEIWSWLHANWSPSKSNYSGSAAEIVAGI